MLPTGLPALKEAGAPVRGERTAAGAGSSAGSPGMMLAAQECQREAPGQSEFWGDLSALTDDFIT